MGAPSASGCSTLASRMRVLQSSAPKPSSHTQRPRVVSHVPRWPQRGSRHCTSPVENASSEYSKCSVPDSPL
jgi:hypothetical protein